MHSSLTVSLQEAKPRKISLFLSSLYIKQRSLTNHKGKTSKKLEAEAQLIAVMQVSKWIRLEEGRSKDSKGEGPPWKEANMKNWGVEMGLTGVQKPKKPYKKAL